MTGAAGDDPGGLETIFARYDALDPITYQVISNRLDFVTREMGITTLRTAYSPIIVEIVDFSCAIADDAGLLAATLNYDPAHLGAIGYATQWVLLDYGYDALRPGDVFVQNDPYRGGTHLNDITVMRPIFAGDRLLGIAANRAHHIDTGGKVVGGLAADARDIFAEGLRIPVIRWFRAGEEQDDVLRLLLENVRFPRAQEADMRAQLASLLVAERRMAEIVERYTVAAVAQAIQARLDHSERGMRHAIESLPDGVYEHADYMDDDGLRAEPVRVSAVVTVAGSDVTIDYSGCDPQALGPINCGYGVLASATFAALLQLLPPSIPFSAGCFRPVEIVAPRGSVVNPSPPAAVFSGVTETSMRLWDCIVGALAQTGSPDLIASTYGTCFGFAGFAGDRDPRRRANFTFFQEGGWGASAARDGWSGVPNQTSNFMDYPTEVLENQLPMVVETVALRPDTGGPGRRRGGLGTKRVYRVESDTLEVACEADRFETGAFGLDGGRPGRPSAALVRPAGADSWVGFKEGFGLISESKFCDVILTRGDRFALCTGGGGGFGDPLERPAAEVQIDVARGRVSPEHARDAYGVVIAIDGAVDEAATAGERARQRDAPPAPTAGVTGIDARSAWQRQTFPGKPNEERTRQDAQVAAGRAAVDPAICRSSCPRQADGRVCLYYNDEAIRNWGPEIFADWTRRRCLQAATVLAAIEQPT
jgi:N-methylhydantoinase B/oxoprolinase/acetone carboxylase alpha subunit